MTDFMQRQHESALEAVLRFRELQASGAIIHHASNRPAEPHKVNEAQGPPRESWRLTYEIGHAGK